MLTDLSGVVKWTYPISYNENLILGTTINELVAVNKTNHTITQLSLETGAVLGETSYPNESVSIQSESKTDKLFLQGDEHLYVYDLETQDIQPFNLNNQIQFDFTSMMYHEGIYYGLTFSKSMVTINLTDGKITETKLRSRNTNSRFDIVEGSYFIQDNKWMMPIERFGAKPKEMYMWLKSTDGLDDEHEWFGKSYQLMLTVTTVDGAEHTAPVVDLPEVVTEVESTQLFEEDYIIPSFDQAFSLKLHFAMLANRQSFKPVKQLPLQVDPLLNDGAIGDIKGTTAPNATVYVSCEKATYSICSGTVQADEAGRFTFSRGIIEGNQTVELYVSDTWEYFQATEASVKKKIVLQQPVIKNPTKILTDTLIEGVSVQTDPYAKIEVRQLNSKSNFKVKEVQADAKGFAQLTTYHSSQPFSYGVFFRVLETDRPYEMVYVSKDYPMPSVSWTKLPKTGDTTITVYNDKLDPQLKISRDGRTEVTKFLTKGLNVISLKEPLREGQTIKLVASFRPELAQTFEKKVTSDAPKVLAVKDVLVTASSAIFTLTHDPNVDINFISNGVVLYTRIVGTDRYHISVKPGTTVVIESSYGTKRKTLSYKVPNATIQSLILTDEMTKRVGKTLPNAKVTLKIGSKIIATSKSNASGIYSLTFNRPRVGAKISFEAKSGIHRDAKSVIVKAGPRPTVTIGKIRSSTKSVTVKTNVAYGTIYVYKGSKVIAKKSISKTTNNVYIGSHRRGTKLTFKVVTPAKRTSQSIKTIY